MPFQGCLCSVVRQHYNRDVGEVAMDITDLPLSNGFLQSSHRKTPSKLDDMIVEALVQVEQSVKPHLIKKGACQIPFVSADLHHFEPRHGRNTLYSLSASACRLMDNECLRQFLPGSTKLRDPVAEQIFGARNGEAFIKRASRALKRSTHLPQSNNLPNNLP